MGLSDIGLENVSGKIVPYILDTTSAEGTINFTSAQSMYVDGDGPDMYGVQMNSVLTNVTLFGNSTYQFWAQNFVSYTSSSGELSFGDNVWNFSSLSGLISQNAYYQNGPNGTLVAPYFYYAVGPTFTVQYPFTVSFFLNTTTIADRPALFFNYSVASSTVNTAGSFDYVVFNSSAGTPSAPAPTAHFQVNGEAYDPIGEVNDIELVVVGNDDGDTTTFFQMNATLSILYWNDTTAAYAPIPSAYGVGTETGETSDGVMTYYTEPGGVVQPVAHMILGPSLLNGLWNVSPASSGVRLFQETQTPANAFLFITNGAAFDQSAAQWVPTIPFGSETTSNFGIPNDGNAYFFEWLLSDYRPAGVLENTAANSTTTFTETMVHANGAGLYTPLIAWGNGELASISRFGAGTNVSPYQIESNQRGSLYPVFSQWNDWTFPVFPGLLLVNTTAWVTVTPPTFQINYPVGFAQTSFVPGLPNSNDLQLEFAYVSNVTLTNAQSISGWLAATVPNVYPMGAAIFWNSSGNVIAGNTFYDQGSSLALYGGTNNTIWGNTFLNASVATGDLSSIFQQPWNVTGIFEAESGDLIYNNYFGVITPAFTPTFDALLCQIECESASYTDTWNVNLEPANATATALDSTLTGSIIGTWYQGGNYWANYGTQANPYGVLPYNDSGFITNYGDYVPLVPYTLFSVTFTESGLAAGTAWNVSALGVMTSSASTTLVLWAPNGTYNFTLPSPAGFQGPENGSFTVQNASVSVSVSFVPVEPVTFWESGLVPGWTWSVSVTEPVNESTVSGTSSASSMVLPLPGGSEPVNYSGIASAFEFPSVNWSANVSTAGVTVLIPFALPEGTLVAQVTPAGANLTVDGQVIAIAANGSASINLTPGIHAIEVTDAGYIPYFNNVSVTSAQVTPLSISLTSIPTAAGISPLVWAVIGLLAALVVVFALIALAYRSRRRRPPPTPIAPAETSAPSPPAGGSTAGPPGEWSEK